jgi:hypothetical protein
MWCRLQRLHGLKCVVFYHLNTGIFVSSPTEGVDIRVPFLCAHIVVRTYILTSRRGDPPSRGTTKYVYVQLVSDSAAQAAGHRLLTAEVRCCIPEHSMRDLGRRTCQYAAGCSQITRAFLCNHHYTTVSC